RSWQTDRPRFVRVSPRLSRRPAMLRRAPRKTLAAIVALVALAASAGAQDPVVVNANEVKARLENARVRVLEATLKPGEKEQMHSHPSYVIYVITGGRVRNHAPDGTTSESELKSGDVVYRDPLTHWAENIGTTTMRMILVELKTPGQQSPPSR